MVLVNDLLRFRTFDLSRFGTLFIFILFISCKSSTDRQSTLTILWEEDRPLGIVISVNPEEGVSSDSVKANIKASVVKDKNTIGPQILGEWVINEHDIVFRPLIPLTRGLKYAIHYRNLKIGEISIPTADPSERPSITGIYPTNDSLPENLLKIYVEFSKPMREGNAIDNLLLIKNETDTLHQVFLDLQTELWNNDRTRLTLWLDPGRIKRDLQPNKSLGNPLNQGNRYRFIIKSDLAAQNGISLEKNYQKAFIVFGRDTISPDPQKWTIKPPNDGTSDELKIETNESLDYVLLNNAIRIIDDANKLVNGRLKVAEHERFILFTPKSNWHRGTYSIEIEARLEDLAGNNLNHLFDRDITVAEKKKPQSIHRLSFVVK